MDDATRGWAWDYYRQGYPPDERTWRFIASQVRLQADRAPKPRETAPFDSWLAELEAAHEAQITEIPESLVKAAISLGGFMLANVLGQPWTTALAIVGSLLLQWYGAEVSGQMDLIGPGGESVLNLSLTALVALGVVARDPKDAKK
jgi:hypothetical protein